MILAGRRINDNMGGYVATEVVRLMNLKRIHAQGSRILVLGLTFKENCPDLRNSKVADVVRELETYGAKVDVCDPWANRAEARHEYGISLVRNPKRGQYDAIVAAVAHDEFKELGIDVVRKFGRRNHVVYDIKYVFGKAEVDGRL
jgi:UDP-N-acetyl-D-galactosamine dehydrogenase